jgi:hypothetical protein
MSNNNAPYGIKLLNGTNSAGLSNDGNVGFGSRTIDTATTYDRYWPIDQLKGTDPWLTTRNQSISEDRVTDRTIRHMMEIVSKTLPQTEQIAQQLNTGYLPTTLAKIHAYFLKYYQYKADNSRFEELRTPVRAYKDRITGVDCDCYAISIASILSNLKIPFAIRRAKYDDSLDFTHVYVVVPKSGSYSRREDYYVLDPVIHLFNYEWPSNAKPQMHTDTPSNSASLSGVFQSFDMEVDRALSGMGIVGSSPPDPVDNYEYILPKNPTPIYEPTAIYNKPIIDIAEVILPKVNEPLVYNTPPPPSPSQLPPPPPPSFYTLTSAERAAAEAAKNAPKYSGEVNITTGDLDDDNIIPESSQASLLPSSILDKFSNIMGSTNQVRNGILLAAAATILYVTFSGGEDAKPKKMNGPGADKKPRRTTGYKVHTLTL